MKNQIIIHNIYIYFIILYNNIIILFYLLYKLFYLIVNYILYIIVL